MAGVDYEERFPTGKQIRSSGRQTGFIMSRTAEPNKRMALLSDGEDFQEK
jgi:hypothetical protein